MSTALRAEIEEMFAELEGCVDRGLLVPWGMHVINKQSGVKTPEQVRAYNQRPEVKERKRIYARERMRQSDVMDRKKWNARRRTLEKLIENWKTDAAVICVGRDVPPSQWISILKNPVSDAERATLGDFVYFLRVCRKQGVKRIAAMLEQPPERIRQVLADRGVKA